MYAKVDSLGFVRTSYSIQFNKTRYQGVLVGSRPEAECKALDDKAK